MQAIGRFISPDAEARFRAAYAEAIARLPVPVGTEVIATSFGRVYVYRFGSDDRVPIVLLSGRAGSTTMWESNIPAWAAERRVFAIEVLGEQD